jgi:hypothetical protein
VTDDFTLEEARAVLAGVRSVARDELRAPFSDADCVALIEAGIEVKDRVRGLIDFPATIAGEAAYWCWLAGEAEIAWWHLRDAGFAGRTAIDG